jgi:hypothetical protein
VVSADDSVERRTAEEVGSPWLITGKGDVYTLSSIGEPARCEDRAESGGGYLDSLDADHATPEEVAAIKAHLRRWLADQ